VDDRTFYPRQGLSPPADCFRVLYYGTFIPLHGVETMIRAAAEFDDLPQVRFDFYGDGPERVPAEALAQELGLTNVHFCGWADKETVAAEIARSHVCLGVFGTTKQARCTIQNKIWEGMAMRRPVITGDSATVRAELEHGRHVYLVERANPQALAAGVRALVAEPALRERLAEDGYARSRENTIAATGATTKSALETLLG
jgi:glycosyltransferase involved in cell wall biosynthesis